MKKQVAFYSGLFDPFTRGHLNIVVRILREYDRVIIGVENDRPDICRYDADVRAQMVRQSIDDLVNLGCGAVQFRKEIVSRLRNDAQIVKVVRIDGEVADAVIQNNADTVIRGIRNEYDQHIEEELRDRILLQLKIRNYELYGYELMQTNGEVIHMSSTVCKDLCDRGEYIAALHHVTPGVHAIMMQKELMKRFEVGFADEADSLTKKNDFLDAVCRVYTVHPYRNFTLVSYLLNRMVIEKGWNLLEKKALMQSGWNNVHAQALILSAIKETPLDSAAWVGRRLKDRRKAEKLQKLILATGIIPTLIEKKDFDDEDRLMMRCVSLILTDEENYPLYLRLIRAENHQRLPREFFERQTAIVNMLESRKVFTDVEADKAKRNIREFAEIG